MLGEYTRRIVEGNWICWTWQYYEAVNEDHLRCVRVYVHARLELMDAAIVIRGVEYGQPRGRLEKAINHVQVYEDLDNIIR